MRWISLVVLFNGLAPHPVLIQAEQRQLSTYSTVSDSPSCTIQYRVYPGRGTAFDPFVFCPVRVAHPKQFPLFLHLG